MNAAILRLVALAAGLTVATAGLLVLNGGKPVTGKLVGDPALIEQYRGNTDTGATTTTAAPPAS